MQDRYDNILNSDENQKVEEYLKYVIKAVKMTREVSMIAEYKCKKLRESIATNDKEKMWTTLQEYIHNYPALFKGIYGVVIVRVNEDYYSSINENDIIYQLNVVRGLIYLNEAMHCAAKETIKSCLKNLLKRSGSFSDKEIEQLLL